MTAAGSMQFLRDANVAVVAAALVAAVTTAGLLQTRAELADLRVTLVTWQARVAEAERSAQALVSAMASGPFESRRSTTRAPSV